MAGFSTKPVVIDGAGHIMGRLAALVAKTSLSGQRVVVVRCEKLNLSGSFYRNKLTYLNFLNKRCNVNPKRGPFHHRSPSKLFLRCVRGMLPVKTRRGRLALNRLKAVEGVPPVYNKRARKVVPEALRQLRLKPGRKFCTLERLSHEVGWGYRDVVATLEARRKIKAKIDYKKRIAEEKLWKKAVRKAAPRLKTYNKVIVSFGLKD
ncbi:hypothetical protein Pcinc_037366 [Petrolisthes cinctipes]|uniref:Large ribosomal subunit protein uL13 n=1 Tax=Petrolisthes cinctipes TaxID=88211 RepID=A0AAE1ELG6_PETCI|nr:hypothetical protein Pcinc_037366 [Petrolisthes cinctipes]KAK3856305.1 hypothetical protein Pcinc_037366 [Petrolisthes cinctipes]